jgi:hypothetical protein
MSHQIDEMKRAFRERIFQPIREQLDCERPCLRVKGPDKQIQSGCSKKKLIAVYFSHLPVVSYKSFGLHQNFGLLLEYQKKKGTFYMKAF